MAIISSKRRRALLCRLPEQEERGDGLTIIHGTAGFAAFGSSTSGYGYSPPLVTLIRADNRLKMCLLFLFFGRNRRNISFLIVASAMFVEHVYQLLQRWNSGREFSEFLILVLVSLSRPMLYALLYVLWHEERGACAEKFVKLG